MAKARFGEVFLGDGLVWLGSNYERLGTKARSLLWSERADVDDGSPNFLWRISAVVWARRSDTVTLATALEETALALGGAKADLEILEDDEVTVARTYGQCRFDGMRRGEGPAESRRDFEDRVVFSFTTDMDPE